MLTPKRIGLTLAATVFTSLIVVIIATTYGAGKTDNPAKGDKIRVLRRKDQRDLRPTAAEIARFRKQQAKEERVLEDTIPKHVPIKVKLRAEKEKAFKDIDNDNWQRDLELEVKNTGTKPIYYMVLLLDMPELKFGGSNMIVSLRFGDKKFMNFASGAKTEDMSLKPGETCILKIRDANALGLEDMKREMIWPVPKKIVLELQEISFGDGTGYRTSGGMPWPPPERKPGAAACLQGPGPSTSVGGSTHANGDLAAWKSSFS